MPTTQPPVANQIGDVLEALQPFADTLSLDRATVQRSLAEVEDDEDIDIGDAIREREDVRVEESDRPSGDLPAPAAGQHAPTADHRGPVTVGVQKEEGDDGLVINFQHAPIQEALDLLGTQAGLNILVSPKVQGTITASMTDVDISTALGAILKSNGLASRQEGKFLYVGPLADIRQMDVSGDEILARIYRPNYVSAAEIEAMITPMLSETIGQVKISTAPTTGIASDSDITGGDTFAGQEVVLVRDFESVLWQIDQVVAELDKRPRQVVIEALILSVKLDDSLTLGVDFELLRNNNHVRVLSSSPISDLANISVSQQGLKVGFLDSNLSAFVQALETIGDTKRSCLTTCPVFEQAKGGSPDWFGTWLCKYNGNRKRCHAGN